MSVKISLKSFAEDMSIGSDMGSRYLNKLTGEVIFISEEEMSAAEEENLDLEDYPDWQKEMISKAKDILFADHYIPMPSQFEIHEWQIMKDFCNELEHGNVREDLEFAIHGRGAFRNFKRNLDRHGLLDDWYGFKEEAFKKKAKEWLTEHGIEYTD